MKDRITFLIGLSVVVVFMQGFNSNNSGGKVRVHTMIIDKRFLEEIKNQKGFESLVFNQKYHNRGLAKDQLSLQANIKSNGSTITLGQTGELEVIDIGEKFDNELFYSIYQLSNREIEKILDHYNDRSGVTAFIFAPEYYKFGKHYIAYRIKPVGKDKKVIPANEVNDKQKGGSGSEKDIILFRTELLLNPSPPARNSIEEVDAQ